MEGDGRARYGELPLQETNKLGGRLEQLFDASGHRQALAGTLGLGALCGAQEREDQTETGEKVSARRCAHDAAFLSRAMERGENGTISSFTSGGIWRQVVANQVKANKFN